MVTVGRSGNTNKAILVYGPHRTTHHANGKPYAHVQDEDQKQQNQNPGPRLLLLLFVWTGRVVVNLLGERREWKVWIICHKPASQRGEQKRRSLSGHAGNRQHDSRDQASAGGG